MINEGRRISILYFTWMCDVSDWKFSSNFYSNDNCRFSNVSSPCFSCLIIWINCFTPFLEQPGFFNTWSAVFISSHLQWLVYGFHRRLYLVQICQFKRSSTVFSSPSRFRFVTYFAFPLCMLSISAMEDYLNLLHYTNIIKAELLHCLNCDLLDFLFIYLFFGSLNPKTFRASRIACDYSCFEVSLMISFPHANI